MKGKGKGKKGKGRGHSHVKTFGSTGKPSFGGGRGGGYLEHRRMLQASRNGRGFDRPWQQRQGSRMSLGDLKSRSRCHNCKQIGHWSKECPLRSKQSAPSTGSSKGTMMSQSSSVGFFCQPPKEVAGQFLTKSVQSFEPQQYVPQSFMSFSALSFVFLSTQKSTGTALVDTAAQHGLVGHDTLLAHDQLLREQFGVQVQWSHECGGTVRGLCGMEETTKIAYVPIGLNGRSGVLRVQVVPGDIPYLLPAYFLTELEAVIDMKHATIMYMKLGITQQMQRLHTGHVAVSIVEFGSGFRIPADFSPQRSQAWATETVPNWSDLPTSHASSAMGPVAALVAVALRLNFPASVASDDVSCSPAPIAKCSSLATSTGTIGEGSFELGSTRTTDDCRGSFLELYGDPWRSECVPRRGQEEADGHDTGPRQILGASVGEVTSMSTQEHQAWREPTGELQQVHRLWPGAVNAPDSGERFESLESHVGLSEAGLHQATDQQGDPTKERESWSHSQSLINVTTHGSEEPFQSRSQSRDRGRLASSLMGGGCRHGDDIPSPHTELRLLPGGGGDPSSPCGRQQVALEVQQSPVPSTPDADGGTVGGSTGCHAVPSMPIQRTHASDCGGEARRDESPMHEPRLRHLHPAVRNPVALQQNEPFQCEIPVIDQGCWLSTFKEKNNVHESFYEILHTLQVDPTTTYVAIGYGDCVKGVTPVVTQTFVSRRIVMTQCGDVSWCAVEVSQVPGDDYHFGIPVHYMVLYEFSADFFNYMAEAEFENEVTLSKTTKAEINGRLDEMLGDLTVYWNLWQEVDGHDDLVEIYGGLQDSNDAIVELYSPPRLVTEARKRGLQAEWSVDLDTGYDLSKPEVKQQVREELSRRRPRLLTTSPPCTKFSPLQNIRAHPELLAEELIPATEHMDFTMEMHEDQLERGDLSLHEHPDTATSWNLGSVQRFLSHDEVLLIKSHLCRFGLNFNGKLSRKSTLFATTCDAIGVCLQKLCNCTGSHQHLIQGLPRQAQVYPPALVKAIIDGLIQDWVDSQQGRPKHMPDLGDLEQWIDELGRNKWQWRQFHDSAVLVVCKPDQIPSCGPGHRNVRWTWVRNPWDGKWIQFEQARTGKPSKFEINYQHMIVLFHHGEFSLTFAEGSPSSVTTAEKSMVLRAHVNLGHPPVKEFVRLLKAAGTRLDVIQYVLREFSCEGCLKEQRQPTRLPAATPRTYDFNIVVGIDLLFVYGASPQEEHPVLNVTCVGTLYSTFTMVHPTRRGSALVWSAFLKSWLRTFGSPSFLIMDQGLEFQGEFIEGLESHGIQPILIDRDAPYQNGVTERRGGLFKEVYYKTRELRQPANVSEVQDMIHEVAWALQTLTNRSGYSPAQRVLGRQPALNMEHLNDSGEFEFSQTQDAAWKRSEEIRQAARKALVEVDGKERLNRALRARPRRAREDCQFSEGEPVYVWRQGRRGNQAKVGPCFVVLQRGDTVWVVRRGELWKCNKAQVFRMGNMEKQGLEAIPAELLRAKERLRFNSEKLGYIDVEREGPFEIQDDEPSQQPAISVEQPSDVHRRVPQTPRGPPEGSRTPIPRTPVPQTPQIQRAAPQTPIVPTATQQQQQTTTIPQPQPVTPPSQHNNQPTTEDQPLEIQDENDDPTTTTTISTGTRPQNRSRSPPPTTTSPARLSQQDTTITPSNTAQQAAATPQQMNDMDELWKANLENQKSKTSYMPRLGGSSASSTSDLRAWSRYDLAAKRFRGTNSHGPLWSDVVRRVTTDLDNSRIIEDLTIVGEMSAKQLHQRLPPGVENIETILVYKPCPDHPDPGKPLDQVPEVPQAPLGKEPEEDARIIDSGMKRGLEEPALSDRQANRSRIFGVWRADEVTDWGNKTKYPVIANARDLDAFPKVAKSDVFYQLKPLDQPLTYLTKQSGKELDWKKLSEDEKKMFVEAKITEIENLVNSNAIAIETDKNTIEKIMREYPHRIMPSRFIFTKKAGELGETWKAKARWILLGHKDPDSLELERYAPTPSSTTVMLCLQVISSMKFRLFIMDVSSAFGQSDPHEREQGPLFAWMPPTGIPGYDSGAIVRVLTAVYGLVNAPAVWRKTVRRHLLELGYVESVFDPCLYYLKVSEDEAADQKYIVAGIVLLDVDDFCQGGNARHQELMNQLRSRLKFGKWRDVYEEDSAEYIGRTLRQMPNYEIQVSMRRYIVEKLKPVTLPKDRLKDKTALLTEKEITWLRGVGGSLLWVGKEGRPDVGAACAMAMSWSSSGPTVEHILMANKTVAELKATPEVVLRVLPVPPDQSIWMSVADASMANVENKSQGGFIIALVNKNILEGKAADFSINSWRSHRLKRVIKATLGSEALAMDDALAEIEWVRALWHEVMDRNSQIMNNSRFGCEESVLVMREPDDEESVASIRLCDEQDGIHVTDAKALYDLLNRRSGNAGHCRRAQIDVAVICVSARTLNVKTFWVPGSAMIADPLTKRLGNGALLRKILASGRYALARDSMGHLDFPPEGCESQDMKPK